MWVFALLMHTTICNICQFEFYSFSNHCQYYHLLLHIPRNLYCNPMHGSVLYFFCWLKSNQILFFIWVISCSYGRVEELVYFASSKGQYEIVVRCYIQVLCIFILFFFYVCVCVCVYIHIYIYVSFSKGKQRMLGKC